MSDNSAMNITEFLEARIAEDAAKAVEAQDWVAKGPTPHIPWYGSQGDNAERILAGAYSLVSSMSPARVLAECTAKRAIIEEHEWRTVGGSTGCGLCNYNRDYGWEETGPCATIRALAAVYKDHPDYRQEWGAGMRIYLAGPMTGIKYFNAPAFADAAFRLRLVGYEVFSPAENDIENGFDVSKMSGTENLSDHGYSLREALKQDLTWICDNADGIALLHGSEKSKGVAAEIALANALGIPVKLYVNWVADTEDEPVDEAA